MYLKRKIDDFLINWKNSSEKKPLIVKGARQIGKTESIKKFAKEYYENVVYINFVEDKKFKVIADDDYSVESIVKNITRINPEIKFITNKTLIIFDELQEYPEIATCLKFFAIDGKYDVICSGSLLGIDYNKIESNSVGYKTDYEMNSLDFEEFLWAKGYSDDIKKDILEHMLTLKPFSKAEMNTYDELFLDYCVLGGMPSVVKSYIENKNFSNTLQIQKQLLLDYKEDITKYTSGLDQGRILNVYNQIPAQLAKENKKFQISKISSEARFKDYRGCIEWLNSAGIINICRCLHTPELPLKGNYEENKYKIYFRDTGLLVASLDEEAQEDLRVNKNIGVYKGALYENIVGDALVKEGYELFYYKREDSSLEEDFFVRTKNNLVPVEVKATNGTSKSLKTLIESEKYKDIEFGIKLCSANIGLSNNIYTFPYFCAFLLKEYLNRDTEITKQRFSNMSTQDYINAFFNYYYNVLPRLSFAEVVNMIEKAINNIEIISSEFRNEVLDCMIKMKNYFLGVSKEYPTKQQLKILIKVLDLYSETYIKNENEKQAFKFVLRLAEYGVDHNPNIL